MAVAGCTNIATSIGGKPGPEAGLLRGKRPWRSAHVSGPNHLTDGIASFPDDPPRTDLTALFGSPEAFVVYDLGAEMPIACAAVDADGDDAYTIALSPDGVTFAPLWTAPPSDYPGMQLRAARDLHGSGRYLRLTASGGDGIYAVAELSAAAVCPPQWPPVLAPQRGTPIDNSVATKAWAFAVLAAAYVLAYRRKLPDFFKLLVAAAGRPDRARVAARRHLAALAVAARAAARRARHRRRRVRDQVRGGAKVRRYQINQNVIPAVPPSAPEARGGPNLNRTQARVPVAMEIARTCQHRRVPNFVMSK